MTAFELVSPWPPKDAEVLLERWESMGSPEITLSPGVSISNLKKWLYPDWPGERLNEQLDTVRDFLATVRQEQAK